MRIISCKSITITVCIVLIAISFLIRFLLYSNIFPIFNNGVNSNTIASYNADTLAVIYLHSYKWNNDLRIPLFCSIESLYQNLAQSTKISVYIFVLQYPPRKILSYLQTYSNLYVIQIEEKDWTIPNIASLKRNNWTMPVSMFSDSYRLMGQWRLTFPFKYAQQRGHKYLLFIDDDSFIRSKLPVDFITLLNSKNILMAYRHIIQDTDPAIGLAELARYFLVSNQLSPTMLFNDCNPPNIHGVHTSNGTNTKGWKCSVPNGNFLIISLDFWFRYDVQEFLSLVIATGDHVIHRWNEQLVIGMLRLLFVRPNEDLPLNFDYAHTRNTSFCKVKGNHVELL